MAKKEQAKTFTGTEALSTMGCYSPMVQKIFATCGIEGFTDHIHQSNLTVKFNGKSVTLENGLARDIYGSLVSMIAYGLGYSGSTFVQNKGVFRVSNNFKSSVPSPWRSSPSPRTSYRPQLRAILLACVVNKLTPEVLTELIQSVMSQTLQAIQDQPEHLITLFFANEIGPVDYEEWAVTLEPLVIDKIVNEMIAEADRYNGIFQRCYDVMVADFIKAEKDLKAAYTPPAPENSEAVPSLEQLKKWAAARGRAVV